MATKIKPIKQFSPSVNIIRDASATLDYIVTSNTQQVCDQILSESKIGIRSFSLVGAYGSGKSSFLWAFEQSLNRKHNFFRIGNANFKNGFDYLPLIGDPSSIVDAFAQLFEVKKRNYTVSDILSAIDKHYASLHRRQKGLLIVIDELGKFLEHAAKNHPDKEIYFIQQLSEYVNDSSKNILLISTLHQDFSGYAINLSRHQQYEWDKVKGRLKEITFNEPVEQLLFLASERLSSLNLKTKVRNISSLLSVIDASKSFPLKDFFNRHIAEKLFPFDILSASVLTLALQKYGQNERSLFSFIQSRDHLSIREFDTESAPYYNLSNVYDYLIFHYHSFLGTKYNPHYAQWAAIRTAIERAEGLLTEDLENAIGLIKTIGLLNIFASAAARINDDFFEGYGRYSIGISNSRKVLRTLSNLKILRFVKHSNKYILFEGTDLDIELAIDEAGNLIERVSNIVPYLNQYFEFPYLLAKSVYYEKGTPRFFAFHLSESPSDVYPEGDIDGYINLVFSDSIKEGEIKRVSAENNEAILYGFYKNTGEAKKLIHEIEKVKKVKENHGEDRVAVRELDGILQHQINLLNHYIRGSIYTRDSPIAWYFRGKKIRVDDERAFNRVLSGICNEVYPHTPIFRNELVNKTKVSSPITTARKNLLRALLNHTDKPDLGFDAIRFPPERTIYLSLLQKTGIHSNSKEGFVLRKPSSKESGIKLIWETCDEFLDSTRHGRRKLGELLDLLLSRPFKLKQGFLDFWVPIYLFAKRDDFALFHRDIYVPFLTEEILELVCKDPRAYEVKAYDIAGVRLNLFNRYRQFLNQSEERKPTNSSFIESIRPFLTFYRDLPEYAKTTKRLNKKSIALREAIAKSKDPEETFFVSFPLALEYTSKHLKNDQSLKEYVDEFENCIRDIRSCFDKLMDRVETFLAEEILGVRPIFQEYKAALGSRFGNLKTHLLLPHQKVFLQRVESQLDDRKVWLNSISQACIGKPLDSLKDMEEDVLFHSLGEMIHEMDNLCELSHGGFDENKEIAFKFEVTDFVEGLKKNLVRLPKKKNHELVQLHNLVKSKLSKDRQLNIATLAKLLQELINDEQ